VSPSWTRIPPVLRALVAQGLAFLLLLVLSRTFPGTRALPSWAWLLGQAILATLLGSLGRLGPGWRVFQFILPFALAWQALHAVPGWVYPLLLLILLLVFGGGLLTRVPLYNSNRAAWAALLELIPDGAHVVDLGAGLGGPLRFLAERKPGARFLGVEASPLVWLAAWLRTRPVRANCAMRLGSLWRVDLEAFDVVYAFLSPAPMEELGRKAFAEMAPGSLLISHSFPVPEWEPERVIPLPGREDACLYLYRVGTIPALAGD